MIGARARRSRLAVSLIAAVLGIGLLFGMRSTDPRRSDPAVADARDAAVQAQAARTTAALAALDAALRRALEAGRHGSAGAVSGSDAPGPHLEAAADELVTATRDVDEASDAVERLAGMLAAVQPDAQQPSLSLQAAELTSIAGQLRAAAAPADDFADKRRVAEATNAALERSLVAFADGRLDDALAAAGEVESYLDELRAWDVELITLPIWMGTTDDLVDGLRGYIEATRAGDDPGATEAAAAYREAAEEAHRADLALGIAIAEGGSSIAGAPLQRLADALREVAGVSVAVASVVQR